MTTVDPTLASMTRKFLDAILPTVVDGYLTGAVGHGPHYNSGGKYEHTQFAPFAYRWPTQRDAAIDHIQSHAATCDVWICPYLMKTAERKKGNAAYRAICHCDCDKVLDVDRARALGDVVIVRSGTLGHGHVYALFDYPVMPAQHELLERGLVAYLDGDPGKISENDLLRPPGTFNHKTPAPTFVMSI